MARFNNPASTGSSTDTYDKLYVTNNGAGTNIKIGDDAWIGDVNLANHISVNGDQDATQGGIVLGSAKTNKIATNGTDLTLTAANDVVLAAGSGFAYIGTPTEANRIAKWSETLFRKTNIPAHDHGASGDLKGMFAHDDTHLYICIANYVNNSTVIWKRINWAGGNW
jgi:hypothetical protein